MKLKIEPGNSTFLVTAGESLPELDYYTNIFNSYTTDALYTTTLKLWNEFSAVHQQNVPKICDPGLSNAIDDISVLIKSQQGASGGLVAGHAYHMGYVRDQYGVSRGLLAMGHVQEAKKIPEFYFLNWQESLSRKFLQKVYQKLMNLRDNTGAWIEYYENGVPLGCRCRTWESGVNIEAAIRYHQKKQRNNAEMLN